MSGSFDNVDNTQSSRGNPDLDVSSNDSPTHGFSYMSQVLGKHSTELINSNQIQVLFRNENLISKAND